MFLLRAIYSTGVKQKQASNSADLDGQQHGFLRYGCSVPFLSDILDSNMIGRPRVLTRTVWSSAPYIPKMLRPYEMHYMSCS